MDKYAELFKNIEPVTLDEEVDQFIKTWPTNETVKKYLTNTAKLYDYMLKSALVQGKAPTEENLGQFNALLEFFGTYSEETRANAPAELAKFMQSCCCMFEAHRFAWIKFLQRAKLRFLVLFTLNDVLLSKFFHIASYAEVQHMGPGIFYKKVVALPESALPKPKPEKEKYRAKVKKPKAKKMSKPEKPLARPKNPKKWGSQDSGQQNPGSTELPLISHKVSNWYDE